MLKVFDYFYYRVCDFYDKHNGSSPGITGLCIVVLMQFFNLITISCAVGLLFHMETVPSKLVGLILLVFLFILNGIYFNNSNYILLKERWKDEDKNTRLRRGMMVLTYIIFSTFTCIGLVISYGGRKF